MKIETKHDISDKFWIVWQRGSVFFISDRPLAIRGLDVMKITRSDNSYIEEYLFGCPGSLLRGWYNEDDMFLCKADARAEQDRRNPAKATQ